jgi:uncharacterized membrane protein
VAAALGRDRRLTALILVGFAILFAAGVWFIYRVAKGWLALRDGDNAVKSPRPAREY